jgi:predicted ester cyclase
VTDHGVDCQTWLSPQWVSHASALTALCRHRENTPITSEDNKALVRRFYEEIDKGNLAAMDELVADEYVDHNPPPFPGLPPGRDGLKQAFQIFWEATPGYHRIDEQIAEGDKVVTRLTAVGKHERDLPGAPRTGNDLKMTAIVIHRVAEGKLVEKWSEKDVLGFLQQIGVMPSPEHGEG